MARQGLYREAPKMPSVIGYEVVGEIIEVGKALSKEIIGKRVLAFCRFGGYAKHVITEEHAFVPIDDAPAEDALALCTAGATAYYMAYYQTKIHKGDRVLVHAASGGVGSLLVQMAVNQGAVVFAKVGQTDKEQIVKDLGAHHVINYRKVDYQNEINETLTKERLDISFNPVAGDTFVKDWQLIGSGGRLVLFGGSQLSYGRLGILSSLNFLRRMGILLPIALMMRSKSVLGVNMLKIADFKPHVLQLCMQEVMKMYLNKEIKPIVGGLFSVNEIAKAHELLSSGKSSGKIIVSWED